MKCTNCGTQSDGNFCPSCGASLRTPEHCTSCGAKLVAGAQFCTQCGQAAGAAQAPRNVAQRSNNVPWYVGGAVLLILGIILVLPRFQQAPPSTSLPSAQVAPFAGGGGGGTPPPLSDNPRENADRLYNRIMSAWSSGDTAQARQFTPMAVQAYEMAQPLDDDGFYHLAMIQNVAGDHAAARATAEQVLARNPNHLLALAAAIEATMPSDLEGARAYARRFLTAYDTEKAKPVGEYLDHERVLPDYQEMARSLTQ